MGYNYQTNIVCLEWTQYYAYLCMVIIMKKYSRIFLVVIIVLFCEGVFAATQSQPELGDPYSEVLPIKQEDVIGFSSYRRLQKYNYINNDPLVSSYINYIGNLLSRNLMDDMRAYRFFIVQSNDINAFALPGGFIGINVGLIKLTENEAQLASVVAHEIAHVKLRHTAEMIANSNVNSIPMWIGIFAGIFSGNAKASMAAIQAGIGMSAQKNVNLVRSNEVEADNLGLEILSNANFKTDEMAKLFKLMEISTGDIQKNLSYLSTHPMYENRIANIKSSAKNDNSQIKNSTNDFLYIKNIMETLTTADINNSIKNIKNKNIFSAHKLSLLYLRKSDYKEAYKTLIPYYKKSPDNLYITILFAKTLVGLNQVDESINVLNKLKNIHPLNKTVPLLLSEILIEHNIKIDYAEKLLQPLESHYILNPNYYRLMSKLYSKKNSIFKSNIYLSEYYVLLDNIDLSIDVLSNAINSNKTSPLEKRRLDEKKTSIICRYRRPLEPIFGEKTCN